MNRGRYQPHPLLPNSSPHSPPQACSQVLSELCQNPYEWETRQEDLEKPLHAAYTTPFMSHQPAFLDLQNTVYNEPDLPVAPITSKGTNTLQRSRHIRGRKPRERPRRPSGPRLPRPKPPQGERFLAPDERCAICLSSCEFFPADPPTSECTHASQVCRSCLVQTIDSVVKNGDPVDGMRCPTIDCRKLLSYTDVQMWTQTQGDGKTSRLFER